MKGKKDGKQPDSMRAYEELTKHQLPSDEDWDYKAELAKAREERYATLNGCEKESQ